MNKIFLISIIASILLAAGVMAETLSVASSNGDAQVYGPIDHYAARDSSDWGSFKPAVLTWIHSLWPTIDGAYWISSSYYIENARDDSWRMFEKEIEIDLCATNISGNLISVDGDNTEEFYLNGVFIGSDGETQGNFNDDYEWNTNKNYSLTGLQPGTNTMQFIVRNYAQNTDDPKINPTGLIYKSDITYDIDSQCEIPQVPEFGMIVGTLTMISAIGVFFFVRRK